MLNMLKALITIDQNNIAYEIVKMKYIKRIVNTSLICLIAIIIRIILYSILSLLITFGNIYIDFTMQIIISIFLCLKTKFIHDIVNIFNNDFYKCTKYIINNYSEQNYRYWKNYVIFCVLMLLYIYFSIVEITSNIIRIYIVQYMICYTYIDISENENHYLRNKLRELKYTKPQNKVIVVDRIMSNNEFISIDKIDTLLEKEFVLINDNHIPRIKSEYDLID